MNEQIIRNAISDSISKSEIMHVTIDSDLSEIETLILATVHSHWDYTYCKSGDEGQDFVDVYSLEEAKDQWRIYVKFEHRSNTF